MKRNQMYRIKGMHCASCAGIIEKTLKKIPGVVEAQVNYGTETARLVFENDTVTPEVFVREIAPLGYTLVIPLATPSSPVISEGMDMALSGGQAKEEKLEELSLLKRQLITIVPFALISIFFMGWDMAGQTLIVSPLSLLWREFFHHLLPLLATYVLFVVGRPYLLGVYRFLRYGQANMDTLIGIGTSAAYVYSFIVSAFEEPLRPFLNVENTYYDVTIVVITFISLGKYLEYRSKLKTGDAIEKLLHLQAKTAWVIRGDETVEIPIDQVAHNDQIIVKPGMKIPVDGVLIAGSSYIDESMVTGEAMPIEKKIGDPAIAGTLNTTGAFTIRATKVGAETLLASIIRMVARAQGSKAPIQNLADTLSSIFVPAVLLIACAALGAWLFIGTPIIGFSQALSFGLTSFVGVLIIACPCALGLATPTAIIVGVGKGAREGILIKDAATLERLHQATVVVVDKTGTITKGKPELVALHNFSEESDKEILGLIATLERQSEHPIASALIASAEEQHVVFGTPENFSAVRGKGVMGDIHGQRYYAGNTKLLEELGLTFDEDTLKQEMVAGKTPIFLANKEKVLAVLMVADALKSEAKAAVTALKNLGLRVVMLTGDNPHTARSIALLVGIEEVVAGVLPHDKLQKIEEFQAAGEVVVMMGDGVNDAPALARADIGIAMGTGTDVAIESAGITLLRGDISKLVKAIRLSQSTMRGIKQNLFFAFIYNVVGIPLAAGLLYPFWGIVLNPVFAGLAMALSSVSVVSNSLRLKTKKL